MEAEQYFWRSLWLCISHQCRLLLPPSNLGWSIFDSRDTLSLAPCSNLKAGRVDMPSAREEGINRYARAKRGRARRSPLRRGPGIARMIFANVTVISSHFLPSSASHSYFGFRLTSVLCNTHVGIEKICIYQTF